jgi:putative membrane protein
MNFLYRIVVTAVVAFGLSYIMPGIYIDSFITALVLALVLAILNALLKPLLIILTLPITIFTFGLFLFVINACMVLLAAKFVDGFRVHGFRWALLFSLLLSLLTTILHRERRRQRDRG